MRVQIGGQGTLGLCSGNAANSSLMLMQGWCNSSKRLFWLKLPFISCRFGEGEQTDRLNWRVCTLYKCSKNKTLSLMWLPLILDCGKVIASNTVFSSVHRMRIQFYCSSRMRSEQCNSHRSKNAFICLYAYIWAQQGMWWCCGLTRCCWTCCPEVWQFKTLRQSELPSLVPSPSNLAVQKHEKDQ